MALRLAVRMAYQRNILALQATLVVGVAHFIASRQITECQSEIVPLAQLIMHFLAEYLSDVGIDHPGMEVRQQRMVSQRHHPYILHFRFHRPEHHRRKPNPRQFIGSGVPFDAGQHLAYTVRSVQVLAQFHEVATGSRPEVIPFIEPVIHLERRCVLLPKW